MLDRSEIGKRGYLHEDFRLFHLKDSRAQKLDYHYHEFDKLILLLGGKVTYVVEGVTYFLQPWDMLLVRHDLIHRPMIDPAEPYERVVVWLGREWLESRSDPGEALDTLCQQLLIAVNRDILQDPTAQDQRDSYRLDAKMEEVLRYIARHLEEELTVDALAGKFYISRYYLMHRFKAVTGYTLHQYISQKRLLRAGELIRSGVPVMKAAEQAGFGDYSTFLRSFQNTFHMSPREFR